MIDLTVISIRTQVEEMFEFINELGSRFSSCQGMSEEKMKSLLCAFDSIVTDFLYEKRNMRCYDD